MKPTIRVPYFEIGTKNGLIQRAVFSVDFALDEEKKEYYRNVIGELGERLHTCIDWEEGHFILQGKEERCPFLNFTVFPFSSAEILYITYSS